MSLYDLFCKLKPRRERKRPKKRRPTETGERRPEIVKALPLSDERSDDRNDPSVVESLPPRLDARELAGPFREAHYVDAAIALEEGRGLTPFEPPKRSK